MCSGTADSPADALNVAKQRLRAPLKCVQDVEVLIAAKYLPFQKILVGVVRNFGLVGLMRSLKLPDRE